MDAMVVTSATPSVPALLVFWKKAPAPVLESVPALLRRVPATRTLDALLKTPALLRTPAAAVMVRLLASVVMPPTPRVPVLLVVWKKEPAAVLLKIPELLRRAAAPPVRKTLDALLKMPALDKRPPGAVMMILLACVAMPATPIVVVLLVDRKKAPAPVLDSMPELLR